MASSFSSQVPIQNEPIEFLPLFHTCDLFRGRGYLKDKMIKPNEICDVFGEEITYLFYGRPAYRYMIGEDAKLMEYYPICFMLDINIDADISRIFPFDTGALHSEMLNKFIHKDNKVDDFLLEADRSRIKDVVLKFFGSNDAYLNYKIKGSLEIDPFDFESIAYKKMHDAFVSDRTDERRVTIEIQAGPKVSLDTGNLIAVIVPTQMMDSPFFKSFLHSVQCDVATYDIDIWDPKTSFALVVKAAKDYIFRKLTI